MQIYFSAPVTATDLAGAYQHHPRFPPQPPRFGYPRLNSPEKKNLHPTRRRFVNLKSEDKPRPSFLCGLVPPHFFDAAGQKPKRNTTNRLTEKRQQKKLRTSLSSSKSDLFKCTPNIEQSIPNYNRCNPSIYIRALYHNRDQSL